MLKVFQKYLNQTIIFFLVRYSLKVMEAGTDKALLDQKMYFANGGVYSVVIQPNPSKKDKVRIYFSRLRKFLINQFHHCHNVGLVLSQHLWLCSVITLTTAYAVLKRT